MRIRLHDQEYNLRDATSKAQLNDLMELKIKTRKDGRAGVDVKTIRAAFIRMGEAFTGAKGDVEDATDEQLSEAVQNAFLELLSDDEFVQNFIGVMFLARRLNGETVTVQEAGAFAFSEIEWVVNTEDEDDDDDTNEGADAVPFTEPVDEAEKPTT